MKFNLHMRAINWYKIILLTVIVIIIVLSGIFITASGGFVCWLTEPQIWGEYGAFIGGILLAFTLLYQIRAFRKQQIESKFFEMVKYYRDNIAEMRIKNPFYNKNAAGNELEEEYVIGRRTIKIIFEQYKVGIKIAKQILDNLDNSISSEELKKLFDKTNKNYKKCKWGNEIKPLEWQKKLKISKVAYLITFWGIPLDEDAELKTYLTPILEDDQITNLINQVKRIVTVSAYNHRDAEKSIYYKNLKYTTRNIFYNDLTVPPSNNTDEKFFSGNQYLLGHYFRHMFQTVKYIDQQSLWILSKSEKYDYIKTLRAQMSNYEQALFFINSLTQLGEKWEFRKKNGKELISDYNLIKNLPQHFIPDLEPQFYYPKVKYEWKENYKPK